MATVQTNLTNSLPDTSINKLYNKSNEASSNNNNNNINNINNNINNKVYGQAAAVICSPPR